ncbi:aldehyde dehydrogenase family protein [Herbiconiux oxytropis]|uniref:aldehyde dehydrogenase family protein n=1 Tax=Herbiconiux oxytropis TaxID=2970915 RepID=UPI0035C747C8
MTLASDSISGCSGQIGGRWRPAAGGFDAIDPSVGEAWAVLPESSPADVDDAVRAAQAAFPAWSRTSAEQRQLVPPSSGRSSRRASSRSCRSTWRRRGKTASGSSRAGPRPRGRASSKHPS